MVFLGRGGGEQGAEGEESAALALHVLNAGGACRHQGERHAALGAPGAAPTPSQPAGALRPKQSFTEHTPVFRQVPEAVQGGPQRIWSSECEQPLSYSMRRQSCCSNNPHYSGPTRRHHRISASALKALRLGIFPAVPSTHHTERRADTGDNLPQKPKLALSSPPHHLMAANLDRVLHTHLTLSHLSQDKFSPPYLFRFAFFFFVAKALRFLGASLSPKLLATCPRWSDRTWKMCFSSRG